MTDAATTRPVPHERTGLSGCLHVAGRHTEVRMSVQSLIGQVVLVRDHRAGVHVGELLSVDMTAGTCELRNARKVWYWRGAGSVHGIASRGLDQAGSRIAAPVDLVATRDVVEIVSMTDVGRESVMSAPEWAP